MPIIETATGVGLIVGALTIMCVKIIAQFQSNKFKICKCFGTECIRDVEIPTHEVNVDDIKSPFSSPIPRPRPTLYVD